MELCTLTAAPPLPYGASVTPEGVRFSLPAPRALAVDLLLFRPGEYEPFAELPFPEHCRTGGVWAMTVHGPLPEDFEYGYRIAADEGYGAERPILSDPYARAYAGRGEWGKPTDPDDPYRYRARLADTEFDWGEDRPPRIPAEQLVLYELHVRGFTRHPSADVARPGSYAGLAEKIPYLRELGVNCVELLPIFEFDERDNPHSDPAAGNPLLNYWGYNPVGFFAPKASFAADPDRPAGELKALIKAMHAAGIEVVLDVVFNHTAEGGIGGPTIALRGIDERAYYLLDDDGVPVNLTAAGNTVACNEPAARALILDSLRTWVTEFHIDGFRFDEASILTRGPGGAPLEDPPLLAEIAADPLLRDVRLIAEGWDPGGLDLVGRFPGGARWSEWNPRYRDAARRFLRGEPYSAREMATRLVGSPDLYSGRGPRAGVNYVTAHDGFTLRDLTSYDRKRNEANGEQDRDGADEELSWNCGIEGPTTDAAVLALRERQQRNALLLLLLSRGTPMLLAGDERGRTQSGNSNAYCHDSELTWVDWAPEPLAARLVEFTRRAIALRRAHPAVHSDAHPDGRSRNDLPPAVTWHGVEGRQPDWDSPRPLLAAMYCEPKPNGAADLVYVVANADAVAAEVRPPAPPPGYGWALAAETAAATGVAEVGHERPLGRDPELRVAAHSVTVLVAVAVTETEIQESNRMESP